MKDFICYSEVNNYKWKGGEIVGEWNSFPDTFKSHQMKELFTVPSHKEGSAGNQKCQK